MKMIALAITSLLSTSLIAQELEWVNSQGHLNSEYAQSVAIDETGNVYVTGLFEGTIDANPDVSEYLLTSNGGTDILFQKFDATGQLVWAQNIGGPLDDQGVSVAIDQLNNPILVADFQSTANFNPFGADSLKTSNGLTDGCVAKYNPAGELIWFVLNGSTGPDGVNEVKVDANNNIYTLGNFSVTVDFEPGMHTTAKTSKGSFDTYIQKLDANGAFVWAKSFGSYTEDFGYGLAVDNNESVFITGIYNAHTNFDVNETACEDSWRTPVGGGDIYILKLDYGGAFEWVKTIGSFYDDEGYSIDVDSNGGIYAVGKFYSNMNFDPNAGLHYVYSEGEADAFCLKLSESGNLEWVHTVGGPANEETNYIHIDQIGGVYLLGTFEETALFDEDEYTLTSYGEKDIFFQKLDADGNVHWTKRIGGNQNELVKNSCLKIDNTGSIYIAGGYQSTCDFAPSEAESIPLTAQGQTDLFVLKLNEHAQLPDLGLAETSIYPNPTSGLVQIVLPEGQDCAKITITDEAGKVLLNTDWVHGNFSIDFSRYANGVYHLFLTPQTGSFYHEKIIVQQ